MEKRAIIELGKTPSEVSGKTSETIKKGQALSKQEKPGLDHEHLRGKIPLK